jgi:hypothetical protein
LNAPVASSSSQSWTRNLFDFGCDAAERSCQAGNCSYAARSFGAHPVQVLKGESRITQLVFDEPDTPCRTYLGIPCDLPLRRVSWVQPRELPAVALHNSSSATSGDGVVFLREGVVAVCMWIFGDFTEAVPEIRSALRGGRIVRSHLASGTGAPSPGIQQLCGDESLLRVIDPLPGSHGEFTSTDDLSALVAASIQLQGSSVRSQRTINVSVPSAHLASPIPGSYLSFLPYDIRSLIDRFLAERLIRHYTLDWHPASNSLSLLAENPVASYSTQIASLPAPSVYYDTPHRPTSFDGRCITITLVLCKQLTMETGSPVAYLRFTFQLQGGAAPRFARNAHYRDTRPQSLEVFIARVALSLCTERKTGVYVASGPLLQQHRLYFPDYVTCSYSHHCFTLKPVCHSRDGLPVFPLRVTTFRKRKHANAPPTYDSRVFVPVGLTANGDVGYHPSEETDFVLNPLPHVLPHLYTVVRRFAPPVPHPELSLAAPMPMPALLSLLGLPYEPTPQELALHVLRLARYSLPQNE